MRTPTVPRDTLARPRRLLGFLALERSGSGRDRSARAERSRSERATRRRLAALRPFDRIVAGYATLAFAIGAGESAVMREWSFAVLGGIMTAFGLALLLHDHRRWRAERPLRQVRKST